MFLVFLFSLSVFVGFGGTINPILQDTSIRPSSNTIEGRVTVGNNQGLENARVFLLDDGYGQLRLAYTDGAGRFRLQGVPRGTFYVRVEPIGGEYDQQTERVEVNPIGMSTTGGGEIFRVEFRFQPKTTNAAKGPTGADATTFHQEIPDPAREEFMKGMKSLDKNDFDSAAASLKKAIELFPDYFYALEMLGTEYLKRQEYEAARPLLAHAVEINKDAYRAFYSLGVTLLELKQREEGIGALRKALELNPDSINANMRLGMTLAEDKTTREEAIQRLKKVADAAGSQVPDSYFELAKLYNLNQQYSESADALEAYIKTLPKNGDQKVQAQIEQFKKIVEKLREKAAATKK